MGFAIRCQRLFAQREGQRFSQTQSPTVEKALLLVVTFFIWVVNKLLWLSVNPLAFHYLTCNWSSTLGTSKAKVSFMLFSFWCNWCHMNKKKKRFLKPIFSQLSHASFQVLSNFVDILLLSSMRDTCGRRRILTTCSEDILKELQNEGVEPFFSPSPWDVWNSPEKLC